MNIYTPTSIIYMATNIVNGKSYIGYTSQKLSNRIRGHKHNAMKNKSNCKFSKAIRKYGFNNFKWNILYQSWDNDYCLKTIEDQLISAYNSIKNGYNSTKGGNLFPIMPGDKHPLFGKEISVIEKKKISENHADVTGEKNPRAKEFTFISPEGKKYKVFGKFKQFCISQNISIATMCKVLKTETPVKRGKSSNWNVTLTG